MATVKINNHMSRVLVMRRPMKPNGSGLIIPAMAFNSNTVIVKPGKSAEIDFWDDIKNNPIYENLLRRRKITVNNDGDPARERSEDPYTSFGDTMKTAESLNPEIDDEEAANVNMELDRGQEQTRKRGRPAKAKAAEALDGLDNAGA